MPFISKLKKIWIRDFPIVTYGLIIFNAAAYLAIVRGDPANVILNFGLIPVTPSPRTMFVFSFLHRDIVHLAGNLFFLWLFGRKVEEAIGAIEYLLLYVGGGFAAAIVHVAIGAAFFPPEWAKQPVIGASGPIAAIAGLFFIRFARHKFRIGEIGIPALPVLMAWLFAQLTLGVLGLYRSSLNIGIAVLNLREVGYWAHIGGFLFGMGIAKVTKMAVAGEKEYLLNSARKSLHRGTLLDVVGKYEALLARDPDDAFAHAELARTWALLDDFDEAERQYNIAARLYLKKGLGDEALSRYDEMRRFRSEANYDPENLFRLACYLEGVGEYERAVELLSRLYSEYPGSSESEMAMLKAGQLYLNRLNRPGPAAAVLSKFMDRYPESEWSRFAGEILARARDSVEQQMQGW